MSRTMKIGILGICPVCEGEFKVRHGKLVHHGFTRPGDGMIHGDCFAVAYEPYQRSTKGCEDYKAAVVVQLEGLKAYLGRLNRGEVTHFSEISRRGAWSEVEVVEYAVGVTDRYTWTRLVEGKIRGTESQIRGCESEVARMDRLIAGWSLKDLREVTEEAASAQLKAERDARAAERAAKKAEKDAKAAALKAKRDAREAAREEAFQVFVTVLKTLDTSDKPQAEKAKEARDAWLSFFSPKTKRQLGDLTDFYYAFRKRDLDPMLIRLELATRQNGDWVRYTYWG